MFVNLKQTTAMTNRILKTAITVLTEIKCYPELYSEILDKLEVPHRATDQLLLYLAKCLC